ncbi:conserved hypothetical protein [Klebsiella pneumoniae]|nr:hypothetical protein HMPREF9538_04432 [Klebsiella sp. MS 92-3]EKF79616.1 Hypothetical protein B819_98981 [Klebsiella pneumoniae subsp. pneumoniae KpQ3]CDI19189.1 conserved hypothetical protein [Klebsiella pneumoniae subsp. pneumoniae T69]CDI19411.1 conserved hypothetical protein [Klebsiella pneumoniae subsp. pneumoniae BJ1-GA]CDK62128.1 hypothetical protein [Klebsiella pneumoniae IS10]SBN33311.1 conserved hypothetical protein [Klebsiella pneumoniae]
MIQALVWTHFFRSSRDTRLISALVCPFQAISFLSLHASFPSFFDLVEKKTVVANCAATGYEYREKKATSMRKIHASVIFVTYIRVHFLFARRSRR